MRITCDPAKRDTTLQERGLDFEDAAFVFDGTTYEIEDTRKDYGEARVVCYGLLNARMVVVCYTPRGAARVDFPAKLVVDLSPDATAQITVNGPSAEDQLALAQRILESLRTSRDPDCYLPVLESMYKSMHVNR